MCQKCGGPLGGRWGKRCYRCHPGGLKRNGEMRPCRQCGKEIYVQPNAAERGEGRFCSYACKNEAQRSKGPGHRYRRPDGYIAIYYPSHPDAGANRFVLEHRLVAEQKYGRRILPTEHVNHINGIRDDNRPENLEVMTPSAHAYISHGQKRLKKAAREAELAALRAEVAEYRRLYGPLPGRE